MLEKTLDQMTDLDFAVFTTGMTGVMAVLSVGVVTGKIAPSELYNVFGAIVALTILTFMVVMMVFSWVYFFIRLVTKGER